MIRTGGWISAPVILTHSTLEDPGVDAPAYFCSHFIDTSPVYLGDFRLTLEDARGSNRIWKRHLGSFTSRNFKMLCEALDFLSLHSVLELCLLVAAEPDSMRFVRGSTQRNLIQAVLAPSPICEVRCGRDSGMLRSYDDATMIAARSGSGAATKAEAVREHAMYSRDILRACLAKVYGNECVSGKPEAACLLTGDIREGGQDEAAGADGERVVQPSPMHQVAPSTG